MTDDRLPLAELLAKAGDGDFLRSVAEAVVQGLADERFLILPHPEVLEYFQRKASDYDRWLRGMRRLQSRLLDADMLPSLKAKA